jgi:hypothetical protein
MFVKRVGKLNLAKNYKEAKDVEKETLPVGGNPRVEDNKTTDKKPLLLTKPREKEPIDLDNVLKLVKKLSNVVDLKMNVGEGSSHHKPFRPFH